jgi:hypothetical protein
MHVCDVCIYTYMYVIRVDGRGYSEEEAWSWTEYPWVQLLFSLQVSKRHYATGDRQEGTTEDVLY